MQLSFSCILLKLNNNLIHNVQSEARSSARSTACYAAHGRAVFGLCQMHVLLPRSGVFWRTRLSSTPHFGHDNHSVSKDVVYRWFVPLSCLVGDLLFFCSQERERDPRFQTFPKPRNWWSFGRCTSFFLLYLRVHSSVEHHSRLMSMGPESRTAAYMQTESKASLVYITDRQQRAAIDSARLYLSCQRQTVP